MNSEPLSATINGIPAGMRIQDLPGVPGLGSLYLRGAGRSVTAKLPGTSQPAAKLPQVAYRVRGIRADSDQLRDYEQLVGERATDSLPAGFVHILAFPVATAVMVRSDFPAPLLGMVHLANAVSVLHPIPVAADLDVTAWVQDLQPHRRGAQLNVVAEVRVLDDAGAAGEVAWRGVSTYLAKGSFLAGKPDDADDPQPARAADEPPSAPHMLWKLPTDVGRQYAAVSGDRNPIHLSGLSAKAFGFPRAIAHGMYTAARALADVGAKRGDRFDWTVEFAKPVLLPSRVALNFTDADAGSTGYEGRHPKTGKRHFTGAVRPTRD